MTETPQTIIMCVGLPGSGKSTWATKWVEEHQGWVRINKDALRVMFYGDTEGRWTVEMEDFVLTVRDHLIHVAQETGCSIVLDDTNLAVKHVLAVEAFALTRGVTIELQDFTSVPLEECLARNKTRIDKKPLKDDVILGMHRRYFENGEWKHIDAFRGMIRS